jgi:hypothetical protein
MPQPARGRPFEVGSVLVVILFITVMFGLFLGSYLSLARQQNSLVVRSQGWNAAIGMAEAGVEEALAQLNPGAPAPVVDRSANGWGGPSGGVYGPVSRTMGTGSYSVLLTADTFPIIYATGYVTVPSLSATLSRTVKVTTTNAPLFSVGLVGINGIVFSGNNVATDSFNSANTNFSTNGQYDPAKASTNGDIASVFGIVNVGNGNVNGKVYLGPTATNSISQNGIVTGGVANDFNVEFEQVVLPAGTSGWVPPQAGSITITNFGTNVVTYQYTFGYPGNPNDNAGGTYAIGGSFLSSANIYVGTNTQVTLLITSSANPANIRVAGLGTNAGQLTIYMDGATFNLSGTNSVGGGNASNLTYYGTANNTKVSLSGNAIFVGTIYAPQADLKFSGGGSSGAVFGAVVAKTVTVTGVYPFHFDQALLGAVRRGFVASSWQEL